jgi:phage terminase Nu1 subunit (DNA packaging protein)
MQPCSKEKEIIKMQELLEERAKQDIAKEGRLVRIEENQLEQNKKLDSIEIKLDRVIEHKADKEEVKDANTKIEAINQGLLTQARSSNGQTIGIIVTAVGVIISLLLALSKR